jgi:hypothetical protein
LKQGAYQVPPIAQVSFPGINAGPVKLINTQGALIFGSERIIYRAGGTQTSYAEMMALPNSRADTTHWLPWYNNVDLDTQLRIANVSNTNASVRVFIGSMEMSGSPFTLAAGTTIGKSYAVNNGPVRIVSNQNIVATARVIYKVNNVNTSFSEMVALPNRQLSKTFWLPWYNNSGDLDTQLRIANVSDSNASVRVFIGGVEMPGSPFTLAAGESTRESFTVNNGPVQIMSTQNIVAAERVIYKVNGVNTSFSEMMALPHGQSDNIYWLPWYNNSAGVNTQLRIANVSNTNASVRVFIGGVEMPGSPFNLASGTSTGKSYAVNNGPVRIVSSQKIVATARVIYFPNGTPVSFTELMALPNGHLDITYWLPWYNSVHLDTQLRFGVP